MDRNCSDHDRPTTRVRFRAALLSVGQPTRQMINPETATDLAGFRKTEAGYFKAGHNIRYRLGERVRNLRQYTIWLGMKNRCYRTADKEYHRYGARGIAVCAEWKTNFKAFYDWAMMSGYADHLTLDRKDNSLGYSPENCRWRTHKEQANNRGNTRQFLFNGESMTIAQAAIKFGLKKRILNRHIWELRLQRGSSVPPELLTPIKIGTLIQLKASDPSWATREVDDGRCSKPTAVFPLGRWTKL